MGVRISGGYYIPLGGRLTPYAFAGMGVSFLSKPYIEVDQSQNIIDIKQEVSPYFSNVVGAGLDFALNPPKTSSQDSADQKEKTIYIIYLEAFYTRIPKITEISDKRFGLVSLNIGLKTTF